MVTPWPAFLIAVRVDVLNREAEVIQRLMAGISEACAQFISDQAKHLDYISSNFHLTREDAAKWFSTVHYPADCTYVSQAVIDHCLDTLKKAQVVQSVPESTLFVDPRTASIHL